MKTSITAGKGTWSVGVGESTLMDGSPTPDFDCGHKHRSAQSAEKCELKIRAYRCDNCSRPWGACSGTFFKCRSPQMVCSARWYNSYIFKMVDGKIVHGLNNND